MASPGKRRETDLMKLMMADYEIQMADGDRVGEFYVKFHGPKSTPYEGGVWKVHVELPEAYPYKSPSIGFINRLYHPNVDEMSGSVCLDVINQSWSPMYDLTNIFEVFLPQLLTYPNPTDPLNGEAASLQLREPERYRQKVMEYVKKYAKPEDFPSGNNRDGDNDGDNESDFSMSDSEDDGDDDGDDDNDNDNDNDNINISINNNINSNNRQDDDDDDDDDNNNNINHNSVNNVSNNATAGTSSSSSSSSAPVAVPGSSSGNGTSSNSNDKGEASNSAARNINSR